jgi:hypothetical protein
MNKIIAFAMTFIMILASTISAFAAGYTDVKPGNWAFDAVNIMSEKAIVKGYPDGSFKPGNTVTYGEFIKMALIAGTGEDAGNAAAGHWASNYYNKALELKYFTQYDIDKSQLGDKIARSDMALIISAILGDVKITDYDKIQEGIEDITYQTPHEYDITKAYAYGILTGYTDKTFRPEKTLSRAESATVIYRLVDESKRVVPGKEPETATNAAVTVPVYKTSDLLDMTKLTQEALANKSAKITDKYELYTDASVWDMVIFREFDGEDCSFDHSLKGFIFLVKDKEIVAYCETTPKYDDGGNYLGYQRSFGIPYNIREVDYIISVPTNDRDDAAQLIKAVLNPFNK